MVLQIHELISVLNEFIFPFIRIAALFSVAPVVSSPFVPLRIKVAIAVVLTLFVLPQQGTAHTFEVFSTVGFVQIVTQLSLGLAMGFILRLVFNALTIAGENIAVTMGLGFAQITDPVNGVTVPIISQFLTIVATLLFLALDGHLALIKVILSSFSFLPVGATFNQPDIFWNVVSWATNMFSGALMVAIPAVTALLITNSALALMTRAAPQLNVFSVGFPITILLGLVIIALTLPSISTVFQHLINSAFEQMPYSN